jgi:hypothetical protein
LNASKVIQKAIRQNHKTLFPADIVYLDTETRKEDLGEFQNNYFKIAWACSIRHRPDSKKVKEEWKFFSEPWPLCRWIERLSLPRRPLWVFSHNLFFDLQVSCFYEYFSLAGWTLDFLYETGMSYIVVIRKGDSFIKGISTTNYFDTSLEEIGKLVGYDKLKVDFDTVSDMDLATYCRRDVEILKLAMEQYFHFVRSHDLGKFGMTKAAQAFNAYRHRFMKQKIFCHQNPVLVDLEKSAYMGGRTECFFIGEIKDRPVVSLDINSMYPFVMKRYKYPCRFLNYQENLPVKELEAVLGKFCAVAEVLVDTPDPHFAVRQGAKIIFPVGRFRCFLCTRGLNFALQRGYVKAVLEVAFYEPADLFTGYVDYFYSLKSRYDSEGNKIYRKLTKYFLNCLYGKFAQFRPVMDWIIDEKGPLAYRSEWFDEVTGERGIEYKLMNKIIRESGKEVSGNSLIPISAHITEDSRLYLDEIMRAMGRSKVLYCDTDSVKIYKSDLKQVRHKIDPQELGALKLEEEYSYLQIVGPKFYITDKERKIKGIPARSKEVEHLVYSYTSFPRQATHLRKGIVDYFETRTVNKRLKISYDKGIVTPSGRVEPFRFREF